MPWESGQFTRSEINRGSVYEGKSTSRNIGKRSVRTRYDAHDTSH